MARKGTRKQRKFDATSIPVLSPRTMQKGKRKRSGRKTTRRRKRDSFLSKILGSWRFSHYVALLLILGGMAALGYLLTDPSFHAAPPSVSGNSYLSAEQILQQAHLEGQNIYTIDPTDISRRLITFVPQIKRAKVSLGLPDQVAIQIEERQPVLMYSHDNQMFWADNEGHLFPIQASLIELPILVDEDGSASPDGKHLDPAIWNAIQEITLSIPEMKEFHYRDVYGLFFVSPEGWRVYLGDSENLQNKLAAWQALRQQLVQENRPIKTVDLRYDRVYIQ